MPKKLFILNERMLALAEWAIEKEMVHTATEFYKKIGFRPTNIGHIKSGTISFTNKQILSAYQLTGVNINWLFGIEPNMIRPEKLKDDSPLEKLKTAVKELEYYLKKV